VNDLFSDFPTQWSIDVVDNVIRDYVGYFIQDLVRQYIPQFYHDSFLK